LSGPTPPDTLTVSRTVEGKRDRVFQAWTNPSEVKKWWTLGEGWTTSTVEIDLRVGGKFSYGNESETGASTEITGEYLEVEPPSRLVFTWRFPGAPSEASTITVEFHELGTQTEVVVTHAKLTPEMVLGAIEGWEAALGSLMMFMLTETGAAELLTKRLNKSENPPSVADQRLALKFSSITQTANIRSTPDKVYDALMDSKKHAAFTGSAAKISGVVGGKFTAWDGYIMGKNLELIKGKKIVQEWSTTEWPEGYPPSRLVITLSKSKGGTLLKMVHSKVPASQRDDYAQGWRDYYWAPLKAFLEGER
jgi:uncharacterized protein YndB with AHSA1/START domain